MPKRRLSAEQIVVLLRQIEVLMSQGKAAGVACREAGISQQSYYRWRKEYGGLEVDQAKRMKELERENIECLNQEIFYSLKEAQVVIEQWRNQYNTIRPHSSLGYRPPAPRTSTGKPHFLDRMLRYISLNPPGSKYPPAYSVTETSYAG
jgi:putative transposase